MFSTSMLYELTVLAKAAPHINVAGLMDTIRNEGWSRRDLEAFKLKNSQPSSRKPKETSRQHKIVNEGAQQVGVIKDWDNGRVLLGVKVTDPAAREQLVAELRKRFGLESDTQLSLR